jgi:putative aldouronate transport system substrate-binding protein
MPLQKDLFQFRHVAMGFNAYPFDWIKAKDGTIVYGGIQPEVKDALALMADWYKKGYFKQDWTAQDGDSVSQDIISGKSGIQNHYQWWGWNPGVDVVRNLGMNAYFEHYELPSKDGSLVNHTYGFQNNGYYIVNKNYQYPDAAVKAMSYVTAVILDATTELNWPMDKIDRFYGPTQDNIHTLAYCFRVTDPSTELVGYEMIQEAKRTKDPSKIVSPVYLNKYLTGVKFTEGDSAGTGDFLQNYSEKCAYATNINVVKNNRWTYTYPRGPIPEEVAAYGSTLSDILVEGWTKIIVGQQPLSYFDTLVAEWKAAGGNVCTAAMNK